MARKTAGAPAAGCRRGRHVVVPALPLDEFVDQPHRHLPVQMTLSAFK
jgi:hypothetical protein